LTVTEAAQDPRASDPGAIRISSSTTTEANAATEARPKGRAFRAAGVTAGAAVVAGILILTRDQSVSTLGAIGIAIGAVALVASAAALREWPGARQWTGPNGAFEGIAGPLAWLAVLFAAVVVLANFIPVIVPAWDREQVFAVAIVGFALLMVLGWGPGVAVAWPSGLRGSALTVVGSVVALGFVAIYLVFMLLLRGDALTADDQSWARLVEIRATFEALAFAAAGALLGTIVQRVAMAGELRSVREEVDVREAELVELRAQLATRELEVDSMRATVVGALRQLTPGAPADLERLDPDEPLVVAARPSSVAVRGARRTLLEGVRILAAGEAPQRLT
jgi:hypothetical protein